MASDLYKVMLWEQAVEQFNECYMPRIRGTEQLYGRANYPDLPMRREAWNNYTDSLCKNRLISDWQYENWSQPAVCDGD
jgi:hypothetical protein